MKIRSINLSLCSFCKPFRFQVIPDLFLCSCSPQGAEPGLLHSAEEQSVLLTKPPGLFFDFGWLQVGDMLSLWAASLFTQATVVLHWTQNKKLMDGFYVCGHAVYAWKFLDTYANSWELGFSFIYCGLRRFCSPKAHIRFGFNGSSWLPVLWKEKIVKKPPSYL